MSLPTLPPTFIFLVLFFYFCDNKKPDQGIIKLSVWHLLNSFICRPTEALNAFLIPSLVVFILFMFSVDLQVYKLDHTN